MSCSPPLLGPSYDHVGSCGQLLALTWTGVSKVLEALEAARTGERTAFKSLADATRQARKKCLSWEKAKSIALIDWVGFDLNLIWFDLTWFGSVRFDST